MPPVILTTVILNWNGADLAIRSAESVLHSYQQAGPGAGFLDLVIVDNGSEEQDRLKLEQWSRRPHSHRVVLVVNDENLGFSCGMNAGIAVALRHGASYLWLLNNDTEVGPGSVAALLDFARTNGDAFVIGATILQAEEGPVLAAGGHRYCAFLGWSRPIGAGLSLQQLSSARLPEPDYIDGAALWLRAELLQRRGGLPEASFLFFEELLLNQLLRPGEEVAWCPDASVVHVGGASSGMLPEGRAGYYAALAAFRYTREVHPLFLPTVIAARVIGIGLVALWRRRPALFLEVLRALWVFLAGQSESTSAYSPDN